jgi:hypothetical protein
MTVLITLTTAGTDSGPFDLYSNLDGYISAFESGVDKTLLLAGYPSALVPDFTTTIRVRSNNPFCTNYVDIPVEQPTTTTTSTSLSCGCFEIETNISQTDLDDATGNTDPANDNLISFFFLDCNGVFSQASYTVAGTYYSTDVCTNNPASILSFRYMKNDILITTVVSTASLSAVCCTTTTTTSSSSSTTTSTTTVDPGTTTTTTTGPVL